MNKKIDTLVRLHIIILLALILGASASFRMAYAATGNAAAYQTIIDEHPRIFINNFNKQVLREKAKGPMSDAFNKLLSSSHTTIPGGLEHIKDYIYKQAYLYQMTGDTQYAANTLTAMGQVPLWVNSYATSQTGDHSIAMEALAIGFDWIYDQLSQDEKEYFISLINSYFEKNEDDLEVTPDYHNYGATAWIGLLMAGLATYGENPVATHYVDYARDIVENGKQMPNAFYHLKRSIDEVDGACNWEGPTYSRKTIFHILRYAEALRTASNNSINPWHTLIPNMESAGYYIMYMTRPDNKYAYASDVNYPGISYFDVNNLAIMQGTLKNGYFKSFIDNYYKWDNGQFLSDVWLGKYSQPLTYYLLWYDPSAGAKPLDELPKSKKFGDTIIMRTGFGQQDTFVKFTSGPHWGFHSQLDHGSFTIFKHSPLAIDSGYYDSWGSGKSHNYNYWKRTVAHNALLVLDPDEKWPQWPSGVVLKNDGGQRWVYCTFSPPNSGSGHGHNKPYSGYDLNERIEEFKMGTIEQHEFHQAYDYIKTDMTSAYNGIYAGQGNNQPQKVKLAEREFVYLRPDYIIVFDRVNAVDSNFRKSWLLHSGSYYDKREKPVLNGNETVVQGTSNEGIMESTDSDLVTITMGQGRLFSKTLLPQKHLTRKIGGNGYEFWVDGSNEPISATTIPADRLADDPGAWRVEIHPTINQNDDHFLHVLYPTDSSSSSMPETVLIRSSGGSGALIHDPIKPRIVMFSNTETLVRSFTYEADLPPSVTTRHLILDMEAGSYDIYQNGKKIYTRIPVSNQGTLHFETTGGSKFQIVNTGQAPDVTPPAPPRGFRISAL